MKNISIIGKFLTVIAVFAVFVVGAAVYATSQMRFMDAQYSRLLDRDAHGTLLVTRASRALNTAHAAIGDLLTSTDEASNQRLSGEIEKALTDFDKYMIDAQTALPQQSELVSLKAAGDAVIGQDCAESIRLGKAATAAADVLASQRFFLSGCASKFSPVVSQMMAETSKLSSMADKRSDELTALANRTIATTYIVILAGLAMVVALGFFVMRNFVTSPLSALNKVMERLAQGDLQAVVSGDDRRDEVGSMARTVQVFKAAALERVALEERLAEERRVQEIVTLDTKGKFDAISRVQAVIEFTADGVILDANDNFLQTLGYSLSEIKGQHHRMFVSPDEVASSSYMDFWSRLQRGEAQAAEFRRIGKGGREVWIQASYNPLFDKDGKVVKVIKYATDVTPRVAAVNKVAQGLSHLAEGDLTFELREPLLPAFEQMRGDLNGAISKLREAMTQVSVNATAIHSGSGEIAVAADDLSRRTEQQAASLEETAAALDEITATVRKTAEGAIHAREVVGAAKSDAEKSGAVVRDAVAAMGGIEKSSNQISQIIGVIDEIAFQTNLLALNAGVEAARAGDAGRGFAVVASEVRALAQRSAEAAKEIKSLISASGQQVSNGVDLVGEAGRALERIVVQVTEINGVVGEIAASAQEQATALNEVNTAVNQMDQVTQQNAAMVEQTTAASHSLAHEAQELSRLISRFSVGAETGQASASRRAPPPRKSASAARPALKTVSSGGGAARRPEPMADEGWEEF